MKGLLLSLLLLSHADSVAQDAGYWTVALRSIGPVEFGMSVTEAQAALRSQLVEDGERISDECYYVVPANGPDGVAFMVENGLIARVDVSTPRVRTSSGAGIGDSEAEIRQVYAGRIRVDPHEYEPGGHYLVFVPRDNEDRQFRLVFETDGQRVLHFRAGLYPAAEYVEGCL
jgi:hypothetical protein